ncbi:hypothetical protein FG167_07290 [Lacinutrix sp. WUR7]|uniref:hypothetical protein n=1 Tax=Lacinutrix sp. WUR7 TaxID=2653681 RepID=UPI00193CB129|nr:hypothetical protein [Lacinutrix sp. WUR7]QRM89048.1 hypothetical protein FG167_07290 [Lacinutrix sp. WUR7]
MIVAFKDRNLRDLCEDEGKCILIYGEEATIQLQNRLLDLFAAESILDVLVGNLKEIRLNDLICFQLELNENYVLELVPNHTDLEDFNLENGIDWSAITRIKITSINKKI